MSAQDYYNELIKIKSYFYPVEKRMEPSKDGFNFQFLE